MKIREIIDPAEEPAFEHDCDRCVFVGNDQPQQNEPRVNQVDMYVHRSPSHVSLIRRYGSEPANYASQAWSDHLSPNFQRVSDAARRNGLIETAGLPYELMAWFGDSKVRDRQGYPLVVYHGTSNPNFKRFKTRGRLGGSMGHWFASTQQAAQQFARPRFAGIEPGVKTCLLHIVNPKVYDSYQEFVQAVQQRMRDGDIDSGMRSLRRSLRQQGYDGVVIHNSDSDLGGVRDDWVAFDPQQIRQINHDQ